MMMMLNRKHRHECLVPRGGLWKPVKRDGVEKRWKGEGKGKGWEESRERAKRQTNANRERNMTACSASSRQNAATPLTKTRRPGEYLKTRLACAIERSKVDKPGRRVQQVVGLNRWWRCGHWTSRGAEQSWPPSAKPIETVFYVKLCDDLCRGPVSYTHLTLPTKA